MKRWFLDTEFMEEPGWMQLLSIALISEDGKEKFYAINREADISRANDWVSKNILPRLFKEWGQYAMTLEEIKFMILHLIPPKPINVVVAEKLGIVPQETDLPDAIWQKPEFWGYYCDYDWVNFCWIFGKMVDLPKGYPMYCLDLKQVSKLNDDLEFKKQDPSQEHHALNDAEWNRQQYIWLREKKIL